MKRVEGAFRVVLIVNMIAWASYASQRTQFMPMQTDLSELDLNRLEKELADPAKRLPAIAVLADFGSVKLYGGGSVIMVDSDAKRDALRERAAKLAQMYTSIDTVSQALDSADPRLQMWSLWFWNAGISKAVQSAGRNPLTLPLEGLTAEEEAWHALMPKVQRLAKNSPYRSQAIDDLAFFAWSENHEFLRSLITTESSAQVVLRLLERTGEPKRDARFSEELLRLLASPDVEVRRSALADIAMNWNNAEMWQVHFAPRVFKRVEELRKSHDDEEKRLANWAAEGLEKIAKIWLERDRSQKH
jgi:hypothetical protein